MSCRSSSVTIRNVARKAGVSIATVSRYINKNAREMGYVSALQVNRIPVAGNLSLSRKFERDIASRVVKGCLEKEEQVALDAGFTGDGDLGFAPFLNPPLTTVQAPTERVGQLASEWLYELLENHPSDEKVITLPTEIIFRRSCGCDCY